MADAAALRSRLRSTDATAPGIQKAAGAMMKHYDRSATVAVTEWRNALHQSRHDQRLPLLYVANEVLQNSKRNRGNKFLEAFSPVLGQSLIFMSQESNPATVEKIRRTVKIWGDRRVFSVRFVNELLRGLEPYRNGQSSVSASASTPVKTRSPSPQPFSPPVAPASASGSAANTGYHRHSPSPSLGNDRHSGSASDSDSDDHAGISVNNHDDDDDDDDDNVFGGASQGASLDITLDLDAAAAASATNAASNAASDSPAASKAADSGRDNGKSGVKRRRNDTKETRRRRPTVLTTNSLLQLWSHVDSLQQRFDNATMNVTAVRHKLNTDENDEQQHIDSLVGDELLDAYRQAHQDQKRIVDARHEYYRIAQERKSLETQGLRYLPWLEAALKQDQEDTEFLNKLETDIVFVADGLKQAQQARAERRQQELQRRQQEEERKRKQKEEAERREFMELSMQRQTEAKPGMVWNPQAQEYQYPNTDEGWRDH